jgi:hypothetical protein
VLKSLLELALVDGETISLNELTLTMHPAVLPVALVIRPVDVIEHAKSVDATFGKVTLILALI